MRVVCVGEVMVELSGMAADGAARIGFGGDTCNTAIYLARLMGPGQVGYLTRLGDEPFGRRIAEALEAEGLLLAGSTFADARQTGLYAITLDDTGERSFTYWRDAAPVRDMLAGDTGAAERDWMNGFAALYVSGITLAVLHEGGLDTMISAMAAFRDAGKTVMFDTNLRPGLWARNHPGLDLAQTYRRAAAAASIVKTGADEVGAIFGATPPQDALPCPLVITTDGHGAVRCWDGRNETRVPIIPVDRVIDATAAGDSFNAGFLAAHLCGADPVTAIGAGHRLASVVIAHHGAIIPASAMPSD